MMMIIIIIIIFIVIVTVISFYFSKKFVASVHFLCPPHSSYVRVKVSHFLHICNF